MAAGDTPAQLHEQFERADRYSRFVSLMRWALPAAAVVMLLMLFSWPNANGDPHSLPTTSAGEREITNLNYRGLNNKGEPMVVTAARAVQVGTVEDLIDLTTVTARLDRAGGGWVTLAAQTGRYDKKSNHVWLTGNVTLKDNGGYDLLTDKAEIDLNTPAQAWGDSKVTGRGPRGAINANGFRITDEGKTVVFTGRSRLILPRSTTGSRP